MTPRLTDMSFALTQHRQREVETTPVQDRRSIRRLARLEATDYQEQLMTCDSDSEREALSKRWLRTYRPS